MEENYFWYVVYTRPRWEKKIAAVLNEKGIENYCPLNRVEKKWSDRKKIIHEPLFKGYLFIKINETKKWEIKLINGIINFVYWLGEPAIVKESEIHDIKKFLQEFDNVEVLDYKLNANDTVIINQGVLMNYKGVIIDVLGNKVRVKIDSMGIQLCAILNKEKISLM